MKQRVGRYLPQKVAGESYTAYIPPPLPCTPPIDLAKLYPFLEKASFAVAELNGILKSIPNTALFIYMYVRKEALLSTQVEGTQSSFSDLMLFEHHEKPAVSLEDVEEVSNYVKAIHYGLDRLKGGFPLCLRLLKEIHAVLLSGERGSRKLPGEFRRSQNWIGGTRPGNALFVPPPVDHLNQCLSDFETFLHDEDLPVLIKAGLAHVQFETIHPFLDGNGRLGRLLVTLLLCFNGMLDEPILYLSFYLKQNRTMYYELLQEVRTNGNWEAWLEFFLQGVSQSAKEAINSAARINALFENDFRKIETLGRASHSCKRTLEFMKRLPQVTVPLLEKALGITAPTARRSLNDLVTLGVIAEVSGKKRDKVYVYREYLNILQEGAEPLEL